MNWFRIVGAIIALAGLGMFVVGVRNSLPMTNAFPGIGSSAGIGVIDLKSFPLGLVMVVVGLCVAIIAGRSPEKLP
jgi:hypothetical protein